MDKKSNASHGLRETKKLILRIVAKRQREVDLELDTFGVELALRSSDRRIVLPVLRFQTFPGPVVAKKEGWERVRWPGGFEVWRRAREGHVETICVPRRPLPYLFVAIQPR